LIVYIVVYTVLVTPRRFFQCLDAPADFFDRDRQEPAVPLPAFSVGNTVELLVNGDEALPAILETINAATRSIQWQVMLFQPDEAGKQIADALAAAARRGVQVQLAFDIDHVVDGSLASPRPRQQRQSARREMDALLQSLRSVGVVALDSGPGVDYALDGVGADATAIQTGIVRASCVSANHYDHRKLLIADGGVAILGGMNVGNEYLYQISPDVGVDMMLEAAARQRDRLPEAWPKWQDVVVRVRGPVVRAMVDEFNWRWQVLGGEALPAPDAAPASGDTRVQFVVQRPGHGEIGARYIQLINGAADEILVASPYVSYDGVLWALMAAAERGVRVVFVFPDQYNDVSLSRRIFRTYVRRMGDSGIEVYDNDLRMAHAKVMVVDNRWTIVGSFNLNYRSFQHDLEDAAVIDDAALAEETAQRVFGPYLFYGTRVTDPETPFWPIIEWLLQPFS
jgi:cardiolipin synthase